MKLRVWHIPNIPNKPFHHEVADQADAILVLNAIAAYDLFLGDLIDSNAQGLEVWYEADEVTDVPTGEWIEWHDEEDNDIDFYRERRQRLGY